MTGAPFDPYRKWLGIPRWEQPPNHYRLLGINLFEHDSEVIETAADRQMGHIRNYQSGPQAASSQQILNELSAARVCLLTPEKKKAYDDQLRVEIARRQGDVNLPGPPFGFFVDGAAKYFFVQTRRLWLAQSTLPAALLALGREIHREGRYRERLGDLYVRLENVSRSLASLQADAAPASATSSGTAKDAEEAQPARAAGSQSKGFLKRAWQSVRTTVKSAFFTSRRKALLREIGREAWKIDRLQSGPADLTAAVQVALTRLEECRKEVAVLSEVPAGHWLSPKRLAWVVLALLGGLVLLYLWLRWVLSPG